MTDNDESESESSFSKLSDTALGLRIFHKLKNGVEPKQTSDAWLSLANELQRGTTVAKAEQAKVHGVKSEQADDEAQWYKTRNEESTYAWTARKIEAGTSSKTKPSSRPATLKAKSSARPVRVKTEVDQYVSMFENCTRAAAALDPMGCNDSIAKTCKKENQCSLTETSVNDMGDDMADNEKQFLQNSRKTTSELKMLTGPNGVKKLRILTYSLSSKGARRQRSRISSTSSMRLMRSMSHLGTPG